jgi:hypothetical protein
MIDTSKLFKDLEELLNTSIDPSLFPYKKGNSIRIGKYVVRSSKKNNKHKVFDCENNVMIADTFTKASAIALAKSLAQNKRNSVVSQILEIDKNIQKWYNDCVFHNHTLHVTTDEFKADIAAVRYDIARQKTDTARSELDKYIYS